jgi:hypothetical protein
MARQTIENRLEGTMTFGLYLIFARDGAARMTRTTPQLGRGERSMYLDIKIPTKIFETPSLRAAITIPEPDARPEIDIEAARIALAEALGCDIVMTVQPSEGV